MCVRMKRSYFIKVIEIYRNESWIEDYVVIKNNNLELLV